ncbi:helicase [Salmonella enterica]|nr:helicase [Salmonella enterica]
MTNNITISELINHTSGKWDDILFRLNITVPENGKHGACPHCGGKDRFRFDNKNGRGTWYCNNCGHGDGLDLVKNVLCVGTGEAISRVIKVCPVDARSSSDKTTPARKEAQKQGRQSAGAKVSGLMSDATQGTSPYLTRKGLTDVMMPVLPDGNILVTLTDIHGTVQGAQFISPDGSKKIMAGSAKKGAFWAASPLPDKPESILIGTGVATTISAGILHDGVIIAALDDGNLKTVAQAVRERWPTAKIIIVADNDWHYPGETDERGKLKVNSGKIHGEKAAMAVNGWLALPPGEIKMDWDDYRQRHGVEAARLAFLACLCQMNASQLYEARRSLGDSVVLSDEEVTALERLNLRYTHVTIGGKHRVVSLKPCQVNGRSHVFEELSQFRNYFLHEKQIAKRSPGAAWLQWPGKAYKPGGVGFYPRPEKCPTDVYNLFTGWGVMPRHGDVSPYLEHLEKVICSGNQGAYEYLVGWLAHLVQKPDEKPSVAIVLKAIPGTGKGSMVKPLLQIMGQYGVQVNGAGQIAGKFNATMANKMMVFADEVTVNNSREADRLKGIISEDTINLERKGIDPEPMPNFSRLIFASNSEQVLRASVRERRYLVLEPAPEHAQEKDYFDRLHTWINADGASHLMAYLLQVDISHFDPRRAPMTAGLVKEIVSNLPPAESYVYGELFSDKPFRGVARLSASEEVERFVTFCRESGIDISIPAARRMTGRILSAIGLERTGRSDRGGIFYDLPATEDAYAWHRIRSQFAAQLNSDVVQVFGEEFSYPSAD